MNYPIKDATYQHYKGNFYQVLCVTTDTETQEKFVSYKCLSTGTYYSRSLKSFMEAVDGVPRFKLYYTMIKDLILNNEE
jgi:hypothetical protein